MIPGTTLVEDTAVYTDWMPRQGCNLILQFEVLDLGNSGQVTINIETKNASEPDSSEATDVTPTPTPTLSSKGLADFSITGAVLKDEVRLKFTGSSSGTAELKWVHFRLLEMIWYDTARPS